MEFEHLIKLINTVAASGLTEFKYEEKGLKVSMGTKQEIQVVAGNAEMMAAPAAVHMAAQSLESAPAAITAEPEGKLITSPLVGTFYSASQEGADPFVSVGDSVKKGQVLAIIEAMKLMNDIESEFDGTITEVFVENGQAVEYGQPLFRIA